MGSAPSDQPSGPRVVVRVRPGASRTAVGGRYGDSALVVTVSARPVDGRANRAVVDAIASAFGVRRSAVTLVSGERGRDKVLHLVGDSDMLRERLVTLRGP